MLFLVTAFGGGLKIVKKFKKWNENKEKVEKWAEQLFIAS